MATFVYNAAKKELLDGTLDPSADDLALTLVMSDTTADTEYDKLTLSAFTTLDQNDGGTFARVSVAGVALLSNITGVNGYARLDANDTVFAAPGAGTRSTVAAILYAVRGAAAPDGADGSNLPIAYFDLGTFTTGASTVTVQWSSDGMLQVA